MAAPALASFRQTFERHTRRLAIACVVLAGLGLGIEAWAEGKPDPRSLAQAAAITIEAAPISSFSRLGVGGSDTGRLQFRGGLVLTAPGSKYFGGWSGLVLDDDARHLFAVSDSGVWMSATLDYEGDAPHGLSNAKLGPLLGPDGAAVRRGRDRDAEAMALRAGTLQSGEMLVAFEQRARITRYAVADGIVGAPLGEIELPKGARKMRGNHGFEAMTVIKGGAYRGSVVAFSERLLDSGRNHTGWLWTASGPQPIHMTNIGDFDVTDCATTADGTLYVLERRFRWLEGVKMRLRRIPAASLAPNATLEGEVLIEADLESQIDNMEGLSVTSLNDGSTLVTMISDDNFNPLLQRTVLLQFTLPGERTAKARPQR